MFGKTISLLPSAPPCSFVAHSPTKRVPNSSLILPIPSPPLPAGGLDSTRTPPPGFYDLLHVPAMDISCLTSSQMLGQFSNTQGPHTDAQVCVTVKGTITHTATAFAQVHTQHMQMCAHITNVCHCCISKSLCLPTDSKKHRLHSPSPSDRRA